MACTEEKPIFKHYCRICKKGFMCGRALGGHMRAHGIGGDEGGNLDDDDDQASDWEDHNKNGDHLRTGRRMYQLRTNPNRLKSVRICENCGKEFLSWKSFLEHGKCSSEDAESLVSSPGGGSDGEYVDGGRRSNCQWSKRKRSLRTKVGSFIRSASATNNNNNYPSSDDDDEDLLLAKCLVDLANARSIEAVEQPEESSASASREEERRNTAAMVTFLPPLATTNYKTNNNSGNSHSSKGLFECKACKKVFNSHQALGGHRASHKKVKGCYAAKQDQIMIDDAMAVAADHHEEHVITNDHEEFFPHNSKSTSSSLQASKFSPSSASASRRKSKVHECTICHRIFSTGQALGGHKRCHWMTSSNSPTDYSSSPPSLPKINHHHHNHHQFHNTNNHQLLINNNHDKSDQGGVLDLNLNLPAAAAQGEEIKRQNPLSFEVFSTDIRLQIWSSNAADITTGPKDDEISNHSQNNVVMKDKTSIINIEENVIRVAEEEDEAESKVKLEKLSELKGISSSPWLQVGIGNSTTLN
ncbi:hypothetical protein M9H77_33405 [Catharanthus roseus]|uniref:Uncharacterized protein n=1 Tax=Catharanthus roseus TaxID=4058 RepID=A0ACB9ZJ47_CATRO|nr:hypothetical protein M9H77_33405 [Catharanthus roseus]